MTQWGVTNLMHSGRIGRPTASHFYKQRICTCEIQHDFSNAICICPTTKIHLSRFRPGHFIACALADPYAMKGGECYLFKRKGGATDFRNGRWTAHGQVRTYAHCYNVATNVCMKHSAVSFFEHPFLNILHMVRLIYFPIMEAPRSEAHKTQYWIGNPDSLPWRWRVFRLCLDTLVANRRCSEQPHYAARMGHDNGMFPTCSNKTPETKAERKDDVLMSGHAAGQRSQFLGFFDAVACCSAKIENFKSLG